jgi:hypothetical protein
MARKLILLVAMVSAALSTGATSAGAQGAGVTHVAGLLEPDLSGVCPPVQQSTPIPPSIVTGSLTGCWYVMTADRMHATPSGSFQGTGTETFAGCLGSICGRLFTTYTFTAKFLPDGSEAHGRCHHPIVGGDGGFAGVTGVIQMHDLPNGCSLYKGTLDLGGASG